MLVIDGESPATIGRDPCTFLSGEPTIYTFSPDDIENAVRNTYQADESGVVYAVTFVRPELLQASAFADVAESWANIWNQNAKVPGVEDIAPDQRVLPLGGLQDIATVAIVSTSGRSSAVVTLVQDEVIPDVFAERIRTEVARLDAIEGNA